MKKPLHVLIVEDVPEDAELMALRLSEEGFPLDRRRVENEPEYRKALEIQPDLILAYWTLPGFSGLRALELMREVGLDIPFIIISGNIGEEAAIDALHHGAYDYVFKDRPERLGNAVRHALEERQLREKHRRSEETLRESEELYRQLFEAESDAVFLIDNETGRIIEANNAASVLYGYSRDELLSKKNSELSAEPEDTRRVTQSTPLDPGKVITIPLRYHRKSDGTVFPVEITGRFFTRHDRSVHIAAIRDITGRKRAEERLRQSEESARQLAQENAIMAEIAKIVSSTLNIDEVYEAFAEEVKKVIPFDRIVINLISTEKSTFRNVYSSGEELRDRNTQDIYPLEGSGNAEMARTGSTLLIQTDDFSEYEERFPMLLSTFQTGFRSILNVPLFSKGKIIGGLLLRSRKSYAYTEKDVRLAERIGSQIAGAIANAWLYAERVQAEKEREVLEEQLRQAQKMEAVGRLAGGVAHDFNNMLSVITGYTELAKDRVGPDDPLYKELEEIWKAARRSTNLVRQLLAFARRQTIAPKVLDLNRLIGESEKMLKRLVGEDIDVRFVPAAELWALKIDPSQIDQILANLAANARDAIRGVGAFSMETANVVLDEDFCSKHSGLTPGEYVMIGLTDSGVGMGKETLDHIFEPFFTTKEVGKGTGLGLSTVYGVVKQNNGFIYVYSEPGLGTTFKIYLPRYTGAIAGEKKEESGRPSAGNETVLVVEDDSQILNLCRKALEKQGYTVLAANQPDEAIALCEQHQGHIHLLVTDVVMPAMNGKEMKGRIEKLRPDIKVLYMSGYTADVIAHRGVLSEGIHFIQKPFSIAALATKVREVLNLQ